MGKANQLAKDHDEGWSYFLNRFKNIRDQEDHYPIFFISDIQYSTENPENVKISAFLYFIRSNILGYDI